MMDWLPEPLRRGLRRTGRQLRLLGRPLHVVYHDAYGAAFPDLPVDPRRAENIVAFLSAEGLLLRRALHRPEPAWWKALERVHDPNYLDRLRDPEHLTSIVGVPIPISLVDRILDHQRLQTGGTMMTVRRARRAGVAVNLGGGFHHAHIDQGGGFCALNDVATAIVDERRRGFDGRILVVDLDLHDGDGTRA
ncbi:MAG: histone deacetylase, partial [Acidobacteriota bacterium]